MKLKKIEVSKSKLRKRLTISICIGIFALAFGIFSFKSIQSGDQEFGTPRILRRGFLFNEKLSMILRSNKRTSPATGPLAKGKIPRVNGMLGLKAPLGIEDYTVQVVTGDKKFELPLGAFTSVTKTNTSTEFRCIEGWSEDITYAGLKFSDFMQIYQVGLKPDGKYYAYVGLETPDGKYYVSIDMESMLHEQTILSYEMNGEPLSLANGAPLRLIIPIKYGIKSLKRIGKIIFSDQRPRDYWAENGYDWYSGF